MKLSKERKSFTENLSAFCNQNRNQMFLTDYKIKIFNFLAGNFRRLAEILGIEPEITKTDDSGETDSAPPADWLERTRHLSPEQWFDFSGENNEAEINTPTEINPTVRKRYRKTTNQIKPANNPSREQSAESKSDAVFTPKKEKTEAIFII